MASKDSSFSVQDYLQSKSWKFYVSLVAGITLAGTGAFLLSNQNSSFKQRRALSNKKEKQQVFSEDMYESMTDTIISVMSAEQRLAASNALKLKGNKVFSEGNYEEAIRLYTQAIRFKADPVFYSNRAACFANLGQNDRVLQDCNDALRLNPVYVKALRRRAHALEKENNLEDALFDFTCVCILDGFKNEAAVISMERLLKIISEKKAIEMLKTKIPKLPSPTFVKAYLDSFRLDQNAIDIPYATDEESGDAYYAKARRSIAEGDYYKSLEQVQRALDIGCSVRAQALNLKGTLIFLEGNSIGALECLNESIDLEPNYIQSYIKRSSIYMEEGRLSEALAEFDKCIKIDPLNPDIYYHRGQVYYISEQYALAAKDYAESIRLDTSFVYSHIQIAVIDYKLGSITTSMQLFEKALAQFPMSAEVCNYYGEILADQGKLREAIDMFSRSMSLSPNNPLPYINKAMLLYQHLGRPDEAIQLCKEALEADPACDAAVASLAQMLLEQDRPNEALIYYEQAIDLARTPAELEHAISYVEATKAQVKFAKEYENVATKLCTLK